MPDQPERRWGRRRIGILVILALLITAGIAATYSPVATPWLLIVAPCIVGFTAAAGFATIGRTLGRRRRLAWLRFPCALLVGLVMAAGFIVSVGALMPRTHVASRSAWYAATPEKTWAVIADFNSHLSWRPGLRSVQRLPDRDGQAVWSTFGGLGPGVPYDVEVFELEISAFLVWLYLPPGKSLADAEDAIKGLDLVVEVSHPPRRLRTRVLDDDIPFGGVWTWDLTAENGGCRVRITEEGFVDSAVLRYCARAAGLTSTMEQHLKALGQRLGEQTSIGP
jgi:MFS family permease